MWLDIAYSKVTNYFIIITVPPIFSIFSFAVLDIKFNSSFILSIYRLGTFVPLPGIDPDQLQIMMESNQKGLLGMFNVFAGGAVSRMAIFALGIMPYISSSIIVQLLTGVSDYFKNLKSQGETGRAKITQITRYGTVLLATNQGYGLAVGL